MRLASEDLEENISFWTSRESVINHYSSIELLELGYKPPSSPSLASLACHLRYMTHSTSSDSESSSRSGRVNLKTRNKKKKKPLLSPQTSINNIWRCFSSPRPQQALTVLPLDQPEKAALNGNHSNELLTEGRLRAVTQCQRKVNEIVKECKRVNMRYRDRDWDLVSTHIDPRTPDWFLVVN
jgi:hypothetical protein